MTNELTTTNDGNPRAMMELALDRGADAAVIGKFMDLQERWDAMQARKAFVIAMAAFKAECPPVIGRDQKNHFGHNASIGALASIVNPLLSKNGLSLSWETMQTGKTVTVTCHVSHEKGHRESTSLTGPEDVSGGKNPIQTIGSTVTYLQRYTMVSALGLSTADQDDADKTPPRPDVAMPRAKAAQDAKPEGDVVTGLVEKVTPKTLPNKTVKYGIMVAGQWYSTFLKSVADIATDAQTQGKPVQLAWIKNGEYINVASICVADAEPALTEEEKAAIERGEQ